VPDKELVAHFKRLVFESFLIGFARCTARGLFGIANETVPPRRRRGTRCITVQVNESGTGTLVARGNLLEAAAVTRRQ
jgi:hypothetical protein